MKTKGGLAVLFSRQADAVAFLSGDSENKSLQGRVFFYTVRGGVIVRTEVTGLPAGTKPCGERIFAFHLHSGQSCTGTPEDAFADVGSHYNPNNCPHPNHAGDFPPLFGTNGNAYSVFLTDRFTIPEILGKTVILHDSPDDFSTQPSGNAGKKIACGIVISTAR